MVGDGITYVVRKEWGRWYLYRRNAVGQLWGITSYDREGAANRAADALNYLTEYEEQPAGVSVRIDDL